MSEARRTGASSLPASALLAWGMWTVAVVCIVAAGVLSGRNPAPSTTEDVHVVSELIWMSSWLGFGVVGALVVSRRPRNRVGWILSGITFGVGLSLVAPAYARYGLVTAPGSVPAAEVAAWVAAWSFIPTVGLVVLLVLLFPDGDVRSGRHRLLTVAALGLVAADSLVYALRPGPVEGDLPPNNPLGVDALDGVLQPATVILGNALGVLFVLAVGHAIMRFRRSRGVERQQFRWFALALAAFPILFMVAIALEEAVIGYDGFDPVVVAFFVCGNGLAVAIGVAVTHHGLYEIDRVLSRTVSYVALTAVLAGVYVAGVMGLGTLARAVTGESGGDVLVAGSTLAVAGLSGPARRRIQRTVDRRFNRARYDGRRIVEEFASALRDEVDVEVLRSRMAATAHRTMQPDRVGVWLRA